MVNSQETALDPVCGMTVHPPNPRGGSFSYREQTYFFCNSKCREKFILDPGKFLNPNTQEEEPPIPGAMYSCPMHPEVRNTGPGSCPFCGMALDPEMPSLQTGPDPEFKDMSRRFWMSLLLGVPLLVLSMSRMKSLNKEDAFIELILATPIVFWGGKPFFIRAWESLKNKSPNMFTLIAMGTGIAYFSSVISLFFPQWFPATFKTQNGQAPVYFESAAMITLLVLLGQMLEMKARRKASQAIEALLSLSPPKAHRMIQDQEEEISIEEIRIGDVLRVKPGERVPTDGKIISGRSAVDESLLTGESFSVEKKAGDSVIGGTLNASGSFLMKAEKVGAETFLSQIISLVVQAQKSRAKIQRVADLAAAYFAPAVVLIAALSGLLWFFFGPQPRLSHALISSISVLIIACPCALGLATPMSIMVGMGRAAEMGILIKSAEALEILGKADVLCVDKTGTLTEGKPRVTTIIAAPGYDESRALSLAASLEKLSEHPLALAVVKSAEERGISLQAVEGFESFPGEGVQGKISGQEILIGNESFMEKHNVNLSSFKEKTQTMRENAQSAVFVAEKGRVAGMMGISDPVRPSTPEALKALAQEGLEIVMLTGDDPTTAKHVAQKLGIKNVKAGILPHQKLEVIRDLQKEGRRVLMAGDGVNDAPALAQADVGLAMGNGTEAAIQSAPIALIHGDLRDIARARKLSQLTLKNIRQNLFWAFGYNALAIPMAAGALYPLFGASSLLSPVMAGVLMSFSSVSVVLNSLRLRKVEI